MATEHEFLLLWTSRKILHVHHLEAELTGMVRSDAVYILLDLCEWKTLLLVVKRKPDLMYSSDVSVYMFPLGRSVWRKTQTMET